MDINIKNDLLQYKINIDSDDIRLKEVIKKALLSNKHIIQVLNNKELESVQAPPDDYYGVNILPYYLISPTQTNVQNYICYETSFNEEFRYNSALKYQIITFTILCEQKNIIDKNTGIARHDLLAALIQNEFNWSNVFGMQVHCTTNIPSVVDTDYAARTVTLTMETPNSIVKTKNKTPYVINSLGG